VSSIKTANALRASTAACALGFAMLSTPSFAQQAPATPTSIANTAAPGDAGQPEDQQTIVVTGTRIARPDLQAASPVAVISGETLKVQNAVTVEQLLQVNPQFQAAGNSASNNPGDGAATVDLRGLGAKRTLVLIDGKRAPEYDTTGAVDVNTIPTALIKRIDILTGGASAVYGSDAIAGVVNFILDDKFIGLKADASTQISTYGDGAINDVSLTGGIGNDHANLVVTGGYSKRQTVKFGDRSLLTHTVDSNDPCLLKPKTCTTDSGGSFNTVPTAFQTSANAAGLQVQNDGTLTGDITPYGFNSVNYAQLPLERYNAMALGRVELTPDIELYARGNYEHTKVIANLAPTATAGNEFEISPDNPLLTADERTAFFNTPGLTLNPDGTSPVDISRRIVETGGRTEIFTTESWQAVAGVRGNITPDFKFDAFFQYGHVKKHGELENDLSLTAVTNALDVVSGPNGPECRVTANGTDPSCVPLNLFVTTPLSAASLAYVLRNATEDTTTSQLVTGGDISGNVNFIKSPWASGPLAIDVGVEYRKEKATTTVSADYASGDLIYYGQGQNVPGVNAAGQFVPGEYDTKEAYIEAKLPLVQDKPFIYALDLEGGFRFSDYSTVGHVYSYKYGGDYSPFEGVRFRGIYQRAVRAPNINELFSPVVGGTGSLTSDPCAGKVSATIAPICVAQGAPAAAVAAGLVPEPNAGQINVFTGGNPNLKAEKSDTYTVGVVINPPRLRALAISLDYYHIKIGNAIEIASPDALIQQCYFEDQSATSPACESIKRNTLTGELRGNQLTVGVPNSYENLAQIKTDGIDLSVEYHGGDEHAFNYDFAYSGNYIFNYLEQTDPTSPSYQYAGHFGTDSSTEEPMPKYKQVVSVNLGYNKVSFLTRWRLIGAVHADADTPILISKIPSVSYFDETVSFNVSDKFTFRIGVQNAFNKNPPIVGSTVGNNFNAGNTFPNVYDAIGRVFFAGVTAAL
jgi:iron complex outermembrane receptor protein